MSNENELAVRRHSLAHLLGAAVLELYPSAQLTLGPAIDDGFYYDVKFEKPITNDDLPKIEEKMRELLKGWDAFSIEEVSKDAALAKYAGNEFKTEIVHDVVARGEKLTFVTSGAFTDLCRGGHAQSMKAVDPHSFCLHSVAGSYWRGDEKNPALTRIYGWAFATPAELEAYKVQREEAKKRDHRLLGKQLGLFVFSDLVGPGLPLWTPKGTALRHTLNDYVWHLRKQRGYMRVTIPHVTRPELYKKSQHWEKYAEDLFKIKTRDEHILCMKPMNCPHHTQIFNSDLRSYRDMPQRYAETTMVYRDEQSGELAGLTRVLSITQDDAHIFCREVQLLDEIKATAGIIEEFYTTMGFNKLTPRFSRRDESKAEKYAGDTKNWEKAEGIIKGLLEEKWAGKWIDGPGEAAFYGPKIDFMAEDAIGRKHQVATIQLDFVQPVNLECSCINEEGKKETVVMIHCAIMGSLERFSATYIEHTGGAFPLWVAPEQVRVLTIGDLGDYLAKIKAQLDATVLEKPLPHNELRYTVDASNESIGKKIHAAQAEKVPVLIVVGKKDAEAGNVTIQHGEKKVVVPVAEVAATIATL